MTVCTRAVEKDLPQLTFCVRVPCAIPTGEAEGAEDGARAERQLHGQARIGRGEGQDQGEVSDGPARLALAGLGDAG